MFFNCLVLIKNKDQFTLGLIAKTKPTKLGFRAQSILNFNFYFSRRPLYLFSSRVKLVYVRLDKFINFSWSFTRPKITPTYLSDRFFLPRPLLLRPSRTFDQIGSPTKLAALVGWPTDHSSRFFDHSSRLTLVEIWRICFLV